MAARKLGGGRILGNGKSLAPPASLEHLKSSSDGTVSLNPEFSLTSPLATSSLSENVNDLTSRVSLENGNENQSAAMAATKLVCPICNEEMMTLLQLNRHLDDNHQELPEIQQDEVKNWFEKQVSKAKKFQPLAVINQRLKGLDVFESNDAPVAQSLQSGSNSSARVSVAELQRPADPDDLVSKSHWQRPAYNDMCTEPSCGKRLGSSNGTVNCRKCGRLFCDEHTLYQMKLSRSAQHEPVRGHWLRVCETCFKSREGYNDHNGLIKDHMNQFSTFRKKKVDKQYLEISRLEKRLTKLTQLLANAPEEIVSNSSSLLNPLNTFAGQKDQRKALEQTIITWEEDAKVLKCPFCQQEFSSWSLRRHHCRICGRVVCADTRTSCSSEVGLSVAAKADPRAEKASKNLSLDIRMCRGCKATIFSRKDFEEELLHKPPDQRSYETLLEFEKGIRLLLANFQRSLVILQDPNKPPSSTQLADASKTRKRLIEFFSKYDILAKSIRDLPTKSATQAKLQNAIYQQASNFLHLHMLPLKTLPRSLKHASPHGANGAHPPLRNGSALASIRFNDVDSASQISSSSAVSAIEAEEKELHERLIVLEEQKFFVSEMIADANKRRKFDEVSSLAINMEDLSKEIDQVNGMLGQLDFAGVYGQGVGLGQTVIGR